ncbi:TraR/DksA C4-type zinc finger protein [candidate division WWE3 bacterium]|uniref:TraR/DksA C4-type zinc finger protein n=1 Tax=candidate division WWE3 bacterium TaxID=2053526 RepID=A0A955LKI5_UNCKA|nr:TraR/DksA C4-type zinc finger protein [candidate division WWE3 bacterium]
MENKTAKEKLVHMFSEVDADIAARRELDPAADDQRDIDNEMEEDYNESEEGFRTRSIVSELEKQRTQIQRALEKIEDNSYGKCDSCNTAIGPDRMLAYPESIYCLDCQAKVDAQQSRSN